MWLSAPLRAVQSFPRCWERLQSIRTAVTKLLELHLTEVVAACWRPAQRPSSRIRTWTCGQSPAHAGRCHSRALQLLLRRAISASAECAPPVHQQIGCSPLHWTTRMCTALRCPCGRVHGASLQLLLQLLLLYPVSMPSPAACRAFPTLPHDLWSMLAVVHERARTVVASSMRALVG